MALGTMFRPPMVGLDIGSAALKAVVLKRSRAGWSLVSAAEVSAPEESDANGAGAPSSRAT